MMKLLRNSEVFSSAAAFLAITVIAVTAALVLDIRFGIFTFVLCAVFAFVHFFTTYRRYRRIAGLAFDINKILHDDSHVSLEKYSEGELALLQSEIYKMTIRLREQQQSLRNDKIYLADSIADISHQIRTPLTSVNLLITMLSKPELTYEKRIETVHRLYELLSHIDRLITALLKISKLDAGTVKFVNETVPLERLLNQACTPLEIPIELREQNLIVNTEGNFCGDISWTAEAIGNIVKNCMEHTPKGGSIIINAVENPLYSEIIISDTGKGISDKDLPHIFERFYKGEDSDEKSFGIGLALARMIITNQNGTVKAENDRKGGAKFTLRFYKSSV